MKKIRFSILINAPREKVWDKLWSDAGYREWTSAFTEGSHAVSDWNEGSRILFLSPGGNGMYGIIEKKAVPSQMTFLHQGEIIDGREEPKDWGGARESYTLSEQNGVTEVMAEMDSTEEFESYFNSTFPKAFALLKAMCER